MHQKLSMTAGCNSSRIYNISVNDSPQPKTLSALLPPTSDPDHKEFLDKRVATPNYAIIYLLIPSTKPLIIRAQVPPRVRDPDRYPLSPAEHLVKSPIATSKIVTGCRIHPSVFAGLIVHARCHCGTTAAASCPPADFKISDVATSNLRAAARRDVLESRGYRKSWVATPWMLIHLPRSRRVQRVPLWLGRQDPRRLL